MRAATLGAHLGTTKPPYHPGKSLYLVIYKVQPPQEP